MRWTALIPVVLLAVSVMVGCKTEEPAPADRTPTVDNATDTVRDTAREAQVSSALIADTDVGSLNIDVEVRGKTVYLDGHVESDAQRTRAGQIAQNTMGTDFNVENRLEVRPPGTAQPSY